MRGEGDLRQFFGLAEGITPACAGRSLHRWLWPFRYKDHPRVCGEKSLGARQGCRRAGSPPRVRGEVPFTAIPPCLHRITPACAGRSESSVLLPRTVEDHPRVCGEKTSMVVSSFASRGSPPRVRGEVKHRLSASCAPRITPACAGRREKRSNRHATKLDHPRVCGEKPFSASHRILKMGSPPRVRGEAGRTEVR